MVQLITIILYINIMITSEEIKVLVVDHIRQVGICTVVTLAFIHEPMGGVNTPTQTTGRLALVT